MQEQVHGWPQIFVAVLPPAGLVPGLVTAVAKIVGKSPAATQLLLAGRIPRIVACFENVFDARSAVEGLVLLGLRASECSGEELHRPSNVLAAHGLRIGELKVDFLDRGGGSTTVHSGDAWIVIRGNVESRQEVERTTTRTKLNLPATLLTGGIPIRRKITEKTVEVSTSTEEFVRIYSRKSAYDFVQIRQHDFDYSCLGSDMGPASLVNFSKLVDRIRRAFAQAAYDDRLTRAFTVDVPSATTWDKIDIACKLICRFWDPSASHGSPAGDAANEV